MNKIKDRITLSVLAGGIGATMMMVIDLIFTLIGISKRSYRTLAAGVWVSSRRQASSWQGQLLGTIMNLALSMGGAFTLVNILTKFGKDNIVLKGLFFGVSFGAVINAMLAVLTSKKIKAKDAGTNLAYVVSNAMFGITAALAASKLGHDSLFGVEHQNDWFQSSSETKVITGIAAR
ncbi:hypothetical protein [Desulfosporosinus youngiae]|uniref:Uncharacterized protein n=1 Tax=Desulfosporosinus youngiae DSM 17734 TaxID=768710 RepID=H5XTF9_9FIRM|nr:hypothetical protein [Desulfosporosinus youngiae]EHQ88418.1 hypothetical protein DesyoDRAFT_1250 [Desulfosporosinus youngiae DSM 17734]